MKIINHMILQRPVYIKTVFKQKQVRIVFFVDKNCVDTLIFYT